VRENFQPKLRYVRTTKTFVFANDKKVLKCSRFLLVKLLESPPLRFARARSMIARRGRNPREKFSSTSGEPTVIHAVRDNRAILKRGEKKQNEIFFSRRMRKVAFIQALGWSRKTSVGK